MTIKRFTSFDEIKPVWLELENNTSHYPFQSFWYQKLFADRFCENKNVYLLGIYEEETLLAIGGFEKDGDTILVLGMKQVLGGQDITDYGDLLWKDKLTEQQISETWKTIVDYFKQLEIKQMQLDFVREDSKTYSVIANDSEAILSGLPRHSFVIPRNDVTVIKQEVAPYIIVPNTWEEYLQSLERKQRHELKRKIKRFEEQQAFHFCSNETITQDFENFIKLHRSSDQAKEKFMSDEMKKFFWEIVSAEKTDYRIDFCFLEMDNKPVAAVMSFIGQEKALLYNSGFDPAYSYYSVGLILHAFLIKKSIEERLTIHDFLRGNERYKYDLGAIDMQLYKLTIPLE